MGVTVTYNCVFYLSSQGVLQHTLAKTDPLISRHGLFHVAITLETLRGLHLLRLRQYDTILSHPAIRRIQPYHFLPGQ